MATEARMSDYVTLVRQATKQLWEAYLELTTLQQEWHGQDYGNTLATYLQNVEVNDANAGLTSAQVGAVVFDTTDHITDALSGVGNTGHRTNITSLL